MKLDNSCSKSDYQQASYLILFSYQIVPLKWPHTTSSILSDKQNNTIMATIIAIQTAGDEDILGGLATENR